MAYSRYVLPFLAAVALVPGPQLVSALDIKYCASVNTATTPTNSSIYQSNGLCFNYCMDMSFSFAILQDTDCWCSDYVPVQSSQVDPGECNLSCPGWPPDTCGNKGLFGYIYLAKVPLGTAGGSTTSPTSTSTSSSSSSSSSTGQTPTSTIGTSSTATPTVHSTTSTSTTPSTSTSGTITTPADTAITTPNTSLKTLTTSGSVSVEIVTVTPIPDKGSGEHTTSHALSTGAIAGIAIGVLAGAAIVAGMAIFYFIRSKRQREEELASRSQSYLGGSAGTGGTPTTAMASVWDGENTSTGRRSSRLMPHDPRMDPFATSIYNRLDNKSRESINTLQDNQDYSRKVLRTTNPDPPDN